MWPVPVAVRAYKCAILFAISAMMLFGGFIGLGYAYDPKSLLRNIYGAPLAELMIYEVQPGMELQFLDAMIKSGPYNKSLFGAVNERILQALPSAEGKTGLFFCVGRYYDTRTAEFIESQRTSAVRAYLARDPVRLNATLVEYLLADWSWEKKKRKELSVLRAQAFQNDEIFQKDISSLSFFKAGYVGQVGMLEFFLGRMTLDQVRAEIANRQGLSGASIFSTGGRYAAYSEYFHAPKTVNKHKFVLATTGNAVSGGQAGVVVQNYTPR